MPPPSAVEVGEEEAKAAQLGLASPTQATQQLRAHLLACLEERRRQPQPFDLLRFLLAQGENLLCDLADGVTHYALYMRYQQTGQVPEAMSYSTFAEKLAWFREYRGLPPRYKRHAERVKGRAI